MRSNNGDEAELLRSKDIRSVFFSEEELARGIAEHVVERFAPGG